MEEWVEFIEARLGAHEFVVEVLLANVIARMPAEAADRFIADLVSKPSRLPPGSGPMPLEDLQRRQQALQSSLEHLVDKAAARSQEIRVLDQNSRR